MKRWGVLLPLTLATLACARRAPAPRSPAMPSPVVARPTAAAAAPAPASSRGSLDAKPAIPPVPIDSALLPADLTLPLALQSPNLKIRSITGRPSIYQRNMMYAAFLPDGRLLTAGGDGALRLWRFDDARLLRVQPPRPDEKGHSIRAWAVSPDGKLVAVHMHPGNLDVYDVDSGRLVRQFTKLYDLRAHAFTGPRTLVLLESPERSKDQQVRAIDAVDGKTIATRALPGAVALAPSRDGSRLAVAGDRWVKVLRSSLAGDPLWSDDRIWICEHNRDTAREQALWFLNHGCSPTLLWNGEGSRLVEVAGTIVTIFDGAAGQRMYQSEWTDFGTAILRATMSGDGKLAIIGDRWGCLLPDFALLFDGKGQRRKRCTSIADDWGGTFTADGRLFASPGRSGLTLFDAATAQGVLVDGGHAGPIRHLAAAPDGRRLLTASDDESVRLWEGPRELRRWRIGSDYLAFAPDGRRFVTTARLPTTWPFDAVFIDADSGAEQLRIPRVARIALSPDGSALASLGLPAGLCLFDARSGARRWCTNADAVNSAGVLAFLPGGGGVVAADGKYRLRAFSLASGKPGRSFGESFTQVFLPILPIGAIGDRPTRAIVEARGSIGGVIHSLAPHAAPPPMQPSLPPPVAVSPDGRYLLALAIDRTFGVISVVRLADGVVVDAVDPCLSDEIFTSAAWSSDGARIYAGGWRGRIYEFDFDRATAASAPPFVSKDQVNLGDCHIRWF
jgi:WD40 repeat protein